MAPLRDDDEWAADTRAVHGTGRRRGSSVAPAIFQAATFRAASAADAARDAQATAPEEFYTRWGNPNAAELAETVAVLEGAEWGVATASGMGAVSSAILSCVKKSGDHVVAQRSLYTATTEMLGRMLPPFGVEVTFVDPRKKGAWQEAVTDRTVLVYAESPANPTMECADLAEAAEAARRVGAVSVADNTFATPVNQRPIERGIDVVVHSATKYMSGHSDTTGGVVVGPRSRIEKVWYVTKILGPTLGPIDAWLIQRGLRTLPLRVRRQNESALVLAEWLAQHPKVAAVAYPGLKTFPQHDLAARQMSGFGGMLSFELDGGVEAAKRFVERVTVATHAVSLGSVETLVTAPAATTHAPLTPTERQRAGIAEGLVRVSAGIEDVEDLKRDFARAMG